MFYQTKSQEEKWMNKKKKELGFLQRR
jgi:hypothetical protein